MDDIPPLNRASAATINHVARKAGVSLKSVSRVINNEPHVSEKLRAKVQAAIDELHYVPDTAARSLAGSRSFMIGLLFDNPSPSYTMKIQTGAYRACVERQYHLRLDQIESSRPLGDVTAQLSAVLRNSRCDGFILTPPLTDNVLVMDFLERRGLHYVRIAPGIEPHRAPGVLIDDEAAAALVANYLWNLGHRRFGVVTGPAEHRAAHKRGPGFLKELRTLGLHEPVQEIDGGCAFRGGIEAGDALLAGPIRPTAIFAVNDDSAAGVMVACSRAGLTVPRDISVCGFDDSWVAQSVWPYLTTIYQPIEEMGYAAARMLLDRSKEELSLEILPFRLVERDSVAAPPET